MPQQKLWLGGGLPLGRGAPSTTATITTALERASPVVPVSPPEPAVPPAAAPATIVNASDGGVAIAGDMNGGQLVVYHGDSVANRLLTWMVGAAVGAVAMYAASPPSSPADRRRSKSP